MTSTPSALLDIPLDSAQWPPWLDQQLISPRLERLVEHLEILFPARIGQTSDLSHVLQDKRSAVLAQGMTALSANQINQLLRSPRLLLELQTNVMLSESAYWDLLISNSKSSDAQAGQWHSIQERIDDLAIEAKRYQPNRQDESTSISPPTIRSIGGRNSKTRHVYAFVIALAASLVMMLGIWKSTKPDLHWGFARPEILQAAVRDDVYLLLIASAADDWFMQPNGTVDELSLKLTEFQDGCQQLISSSHPQLTDPRDRRWLVEKCRQWSDKIAVLQQELKQGTKTLDEINAIADTIIQSLQKSLRERTSTVG